jgi:hypothetical protein
MTEQTLLKVSAIGASMVRMPDDEAKLRANKQLVIRFNREAIARGGCRGGARAYGVR